MSNESSTARVDRGPTSGVHPAVKPAPKPLLASEVLREEIAPLEPARRGYRIGLAALALALAALGVALRLGVGAPALDPDAGTIAFSAAGAALAVAVLPFPYALRAGVALLLSAVLMVLGLRGAGPLAGLAVDGGFALDVARLTVIVALPGALLFRSRYIAYSRARVVLAAAIAAALPFVVMEVVLALNASAPGVARIAAGVNVVVVLLALFGFLGDGAGRLWSTLVLVCLSAEIGVRQLTPLADADTGWLTYPITAAGVLVTGVIGGWALFQLLAAALAPHARRASMSRPSQVSDEG